VCQRLYIASAKPVASVKRSKVEPYLEVWPAEKHEEGVRRHFPVTEFPYFYVAGGHSSCGCGFPEALPGGKSRFRDEPEERHTMARLVELLRPVVSSRPRVQLYLCFIGHENEEPVARRSSSLRELQGPNFHFRDLEIVTVFKGA
jgi:hypothetical protein